MAENITCPSCGTSKTSKLLEVKDYLVSGEMFSIYHCDECTLCFTWPVPDEDQIGSYYQSEHYISHTDTQAGVINKAYHFVRKYALRQKRKWVEKATGQNHGKILDIGCGTGAFLNEMKKAGWQVTGLEPDEMARQVAGRKYQLMPLPSEAIFDLPAQSYDAITLWHVLEHVHSLHEYLQKIHELLQPEGRAFIALPNYTSADAKQYGAHWAAWDVPRHLYHFSPHAFLQLAARHRFRCLAQIAMPFDAFYISLLSEKYRSGHTRYLAGFANGLRSRTYAGKDSARASAVLYVLGKDENLQ